MRYELYTNISNDPESSNEILYSNITGLYFDLEIYMDGGGNLLVVVSLIHLWNLVPIIHPLIGPAGFIARQVANLGLSRINKRNFNSIQYEFNST